MKDLPNEDSSSDKHRNLQTLVELLSNEIESIEVGLQRSGLTKWALLVGMAYLVWILIGTIEGKKPVFAPALALYTSFSMLYVVALFALHLFSDSRSYDVGSIRFMRIVGMLCGVRLSPFFIFSGSWIFSIVYYGVRTGRGWPVISLSFACAMLLGVITALMLARFIPIPVGVRPQSRTSKLSVLLWVLFGLAGVAWLAWDLGLSGQLRTAEWRMALLLFALAQLIEFSVRLQPVRPIRNELVKLRRQILLQEIGYSEARQEVDIALRGSTLARAMGLPLQQVLQTNSDRLEVLRQLHRNLKAIRGALEGFEKAPSDEHAATVNALMKAGEEMLDQWDSCSEELEKRTKALFRRVNVLGAFFPDCAQETQNLLNDIVSVFKEAESHTERNKQEVAGIKKKLAQLDSVQANENSKM